MHGHTDISSALEHQTLSYSDAFMLLTSNFCLNPDLNIRFLFSQTLSFYVYTFIAIQATRESILSWIF